MLVSAVNITFITMNVLRAVWEVDDITPFVGQVARGCVQEGGSGMTDNDMRM